MNTKKWLTYTVGVLLTLIALAAVGLAGFRIGMRQNAFVARIGRGFGPALVQRPGGGGPMNEGNTTGNGHQTPPGYGNFNGNHWGRMDNPRGNNFNGRSMDERRGGAHMFFFPLWGLIQLAIVGLLIWGGYKLFQKSGWRLVRSPAETVEDKQSEKPETKGKKNKSR